MIYFISDVHLGYDGHEENARLEHNLLLFLDKISSNAEHLVIAGDLFDYWFDYKTVIPRPYFRILAALDRLQRSGIEITYVIGNHDFGHLNFFEKELGILPHQQDVIREFYGKKFYISHGDGLLYNDWGYKILKKVIRNRFAQWLYRKFHPDFGISLANGSSSKSRNYTKSKDYGPIDGMKDYAKKMIDNGADYVIMGHRHKPEKTDLGSGYYVNLGEWVRNPHFACFDGNTLELKKVSEIIDIK